MNWKNPEGLIRQTNENNKLLFPRTAFRCIIIHECNNGKLLSWGHIVHWIYSDFVL